MEKVNRNTIVEPSEIKTDKKKVRLAIGGVGIFVLLVLFFYNALGGFTPKIGDPLAQFTTKRQCSFLVMPDVSRAVCTDGTVFDVEQIGSPADPLP